LEEETSCQPLKKYMKKSIYLLIAALGVSINMLASADLTTKKYKVGNFNSLEIGNEFEVHIFKGNTYSISATGTESNIEDLEVQVVGSTLEVSIDYKLSKWITWSSGNSKIVLNITMPRLKDAEFSGAAKVMLEGFVDEEEMTLHGSGAVKLISTKLVADKLTLDLSGASKIEMKGQVLKLSIDLSGASHLDLTEMIARDADVDASGASHVELNVQKSLRVEASGASKITYLGNPVISKDLSGASFVRRAN
jgi:hypothetical protein